MNKKSAGFTLIELILGMTILAVIGLMTIPDYVIAADEAKANAKWDISVSAKNSRSALTEQSGSTPTVIALAENLSVSGAEPVAGGIRVRVDGDSYTIPTYTNALCNEPTRKINDQVGCVGSIH